MRNRIKLKQLGLDQIQISTLPNKPPYKILPNSTLFTYFLPNSDQIHTLKCPNDYISQILVKYLIKEGEHYDHNTEVIELEDCKHPVRFGQLCGVCGFSLDTTEPEVYISHDTMKIKVSAEEAELLEKKNARRLLKEKKLSLILDLDQTLLHATFHPTPVQYEDASIFSFQLRQPGYYYIKPRPYLSEFLQKLALKYELHIYTMGSREYATQIVHHIDPSHSLFYDRVLSRDESGSLDKKTISRLFPCDGSMVAVVDDRGDIWEESGNLIWVSAYSYFEGVGDLNAVSGYQRNGSEGVLQRVCDVLEQVHDLFFERFGLINEQSIEKFLNTSKDKKVITVQSLLSEIKARVFSGCHICLSGVNQFFLQTLLKQYGAKVTDSLTQEVTHLVVIRKGDKIKPAVSMQRQGWPGKLVKIDWIWASLEQWAAVSEEGYLYDTQDIEITDDKKLDPNDLDQIMAELDEFESDSSEEVEILEPNKKRTRDEDHEGTLKIPKVADSSTDEEALENDLLAFLEETE